MVRRLPDNELLSGNIGSPPLDLAQSRTLSLLLELTPARAHACPPADKRLEASRLSFLFKRFPLPYAAASPAYILQISAASQDVKIAFLPQQTIAFMGGATTPPLDADPSGVCGCVACAFWLDAEDGLFGYVSHDETFSSHYFGAPE